MKSVDEIVDLWPSMADLARDLDVPYSTVAAWKQRGSIPVGYWRHLIDAAQRRRFASVTSMALIEAHDPAAADPPPPGFAEDAPPLDNKPAVTSADENAGQFSRWKQLRRSHFVSVGEAVDHIRALRSEWDRR